MDLLRDALLISRLVCEGPSLVTSNPSCRFRAASGEKNVANAACESRRGVICHAAEAHIVASFLEVYKGQVLRLRLGDRGWRIWLGEHNWDVNGRDARVTKRKLSAQ